MKDEELKKTTGDENKRSVEKKPIEISPEAKEERLLLSGLLIQQTEDLAKAALKRKREIEEREIELNSGKIISIKQINHFVTAHRRAYTAIFPNENPFFKNMFRLHPSLFGLNPNEYVKPPLVGKLLKHLTYDRFDVEILSALRVLAMPDGIGLDKCHQYLTPKGVENFIQYRDQANEMMGKFDDLKWYEFNSEYSKKYKLVFQPKML